MNCRPRRPSQRERASAPPGPVFCRAKAPHLIPPPAAFAKNSRAARAFLSKVSCLLSTYSLTALLLLSLFWLLLRLLLLLLLLLLWKLSRSRLLSRVSSVPLETAPQLSSSLRPVEFEAVEVPELLPNGRGKIGFFRGGVPGDRGGGACWACCGIGFLGTMEAR